MTLQLCHVLCVPRWPSRLLQRSQIFKIYELKVWCHAGLINAAMLNIRKSSFCSRPVVALAVPALCWCLFPVQSVGGERRHRPRVAAGGAPPGGGTWVEDVVSVRPAHPQHAQTRLALWTCQHDNCDIPHPEMCGQHLGGGKGGLADYWCLGQWVVIAYCGRLEERQVWYNFTLGIYCYGNKY